MSNQQRILITGATGKVGQTLIARLLGDPAFDHFVVRALCHNRVLEQRERLEIVRGPAHASGGRSGVSSAAGSGRTGPLPPNRRPASHVNRNSSGMACQKPSRKNGWKNTPHAA